MSISLSSRRTLLFTWMALMAATLGTMAAGKVGLNVSLGPLWSTLLLVLAGLKVGLILWFYLNLQHSSRGWKTGFVMFVLAILAFIWGAYLLTPTI